MKKLKEQRGETAMKSLKVKKIFQQRLSLLIDDMAINPSEQKEERPIYSE